MEIFHFENAVIKSFKNLQTRMLKLLDYREQLRQISLFLKPPLSGKLD